MNERPGAGPRYVEVNGEPRRFKRTVREAFNEEGDTLSVFGIEHMPPVPVRRPLIARAFRALNTLPERLFK